MIQDNTQRKKGLWTISYEEHNFEWQAIYIERVNSRLLRFLQHRLQGNVGYRAGVGNNFVSRATSGFQILAVGRTDFFPRMICLSKSICGPEKGKLFENFQVHYNFYILCIQLQTFKSDLGSVSVTWSVFQPQNNTPTPAIGQLCRYAQTFLNITLSRNSTGNGRKYRTVWHAWGH